MLIGRSWRVWAEVGAYRRKLVVMGGSWCLWAKVCTGSYRWKFVGMSGSRDLLVKVSNQNSGIL